MHLGMGVKRRDWSFIQGDATRLPLADKSVGLAFGSPPYMDARTYGINAQRDCDEWVKWMLLVTAEAVRVSRGAVMWVVAGVTRDKCYWPGPEMLLAEWWKQGGQCWRPCYWHRVGIPGSGGKQWFRADVEYVLCFKGPGDLPWSNNTANGHPPKWGPGGEMSYRQSNGARVNQWGHSADSGATVTDGDFVRSKGKRPSHREALGFGAGYARTRPGRGRVTIANGEVERNGDSVKLTAAEKLEMGAKRHTKRGPGDNDEMCDQVYLPPTLANPGNLVKIIVGGGVMGHPLAHENEAPFPIDLARWFIKSHCKPGDIVLDPFSGSGTTVDAAVQEGRVGIGIDIRQSQVELGIRRMKNPHAKKVKKQKQQREPQGVLFAGVGEVQP